jgi:hypothetical protein
MPDTTRRGFLRRAFAFLAPGNALGLEWVRRDAGRPGPARYLHIHGNEATARAVLLAALPELRGKALLVSSAERMISVNGFRIDPNRMWSREGAEKSILRNNPKPAEGALLTFLDHLDRERERLLNELLPPAGGLLIALHNNGPGYSIATEIPLSDRVHQPQLSQPRNFMLFTNERDFELAAASNYNAVLQATMKGEDDGSLSRLCAARGVRYANLECELGAAEAQRERLLWLAETMPDTRFAGFTSHAHGLWSQENGVITGVSDHARPGPGYLLTDREYTDMRLELDFWISKGGNSGIYIRQPLRKFSTKGDERAAQRPTDGHEIQIDYNDPKNYTGAVYNFRKPFKVVGGEERWNHCVIECRGRRVTVEINGELVNDYDKLRSPRGATGFQVHGQQPHDHVVRFRNVVVQELTGAAGAG